jgi:anti-sigma regulatory factor (Ser/Thr protein kinase)
MLLTIPNNFTANEFHCVWAAALVIAEKKPSEVIIDASQLKYFDVEGANYLALIPCFLRKKFKPITIILPTLEETYSYMGIIGLLDFLSKYFILTRPDKSQTHRNFIPINGNISFSLSNKVNTSIVYERQKAELYKNNILLKRLDDLSQKLSSRVCRALVELVNNIFDHSQQTLGCVSFHFYKDHPKSGGMDRFMIAVSDLGIGIKNSFTNVNNKTIISSAPDTKFLEYAIRKGTTSTNIFGRGNGLPIAVAQANKVHISSGKGTLYIDNSFSKPNIRSQNTNLLKGTSIRLIFDLDKDDELPLIEEKKQNNYRIIRNGIEIKRF